MASNKKNRYKLSKGRKEQLAQARQNAKDDYNRRQKEKQNRALIQQYNATHKNAPKQTISAKDGIRNTRQSTGTTRSTAGKTRMNGSLGNSFGGSKTGGAKTTTDRRASAAHKADAERRQSTTLRQGSSYLTGGSTRKATPYAAAQQVYTPLRSNDRRARAGRAADANRTINARNQVAANTQMKTGTGKTWNEKEERQKAIDTLNANSMAWHNTSDEAEKTRLHAANDRIRKKFGMTYNGDTGATYLPKASGGKTNVSKPVVETARNAAFGQNYQTQEQRQSRYDELNNEIDRMQKQYPYLIAMDMKNRNAGEKLAAVPWLISHPKLAAAGINGDDQYSKMSTTNKKQADAMYQLYKRLNDEADAISKQSAGKAWGSGVANAGLSVTGALENAGRYVSGTMNKAAGDVLNLVGAKDAGKFLRDTAQKTLEGSLSDSAMQKVNDWAQPVGAAKKAQEIAGSGSRMASSIAAGPAGMGLIYADSAKSATAEALNDGANLDQAMLYGAGSGLTEVGTEKMFGGIPGLNEGVAKLGSKSRILNKAFDVLGEGVEEAASTLINPYLKRATYDKNAKNATAQELLDSAKGGMALAGIMQGANAVSERLANRRYGTAPAETTTSIHDANADVRAAEQMDNRLHPNTPQALPTGQRLALPEGNTRTANTLYANENGGVANNLRAFNNADTPDVLYGNMRGDFTSAPDSGSVLFASQNGQVSQTLPTGYLPVGRSGLTKVAAMGETKTVPFLSENPEGMSRSEMQWAKLLVDNSLKTGIPVQTYVDEIVTPTMQAVNETIADVQQYIADYIARKDAQRTHEKGKNLMHHENGTTERLSLNEPWYSEWYKRLGNRKPAKKHYSMIAENIVSNELKKGGGDWVSHELAQDWAEAQHIQAAYDAIGDDAVSAEITPEGLKVIMNGTPAHTANIQDTNAKRDRNIISPVMQGATAAPINLSPMQRAGQTQSAPTLADVRKARNDIMPKLTRAGAETVQTGVQTAPPEITQPMQENAQAAAQQADISPKLTKAEVNAESSVGAAKGGFDPYSKMVNDYGSIPDGMNPARMVDVPQSTNGTDRVSNVARTIMESGVTPDNLIPALENHVAEGLFSHDVKSLKKTLSGATKTIQKKGWQGAFDQWEEVTDGRRAVTDDDIALGQMMYTAAVEAGDTQTAMKLAGDLAVQGTALGRGVNAFKLLKKTTPEGQLYYLQKAVQKIQQEYQSRFDKQANKDLKKELKRADTAGKRGKQTAIISDTNAAIEQAAQEVAKEATGEATTQSNGKENGKRTLPKATDKGVGKDDVYDGRPKDRYTPATDWAKETGNDLAKRIADKLNPAPTQRPVSRTILSDLMQFAEEHALPKKQQAPKRQAVDRLRDYFANKDFYTKAWNEARSALKEKYKGNAEALDALESFTDATIDYNADPLHTQKVIMNALMDDIKETGGLKTYLARNTLGAGEQNAAQLADRLIAETGVTGTDAEVLRSGVNHAYEDMMDGKSGTKLETMIREALKSGNLNLTDAAKMSPKQKAVVGQTISGLLQKEYGVDAQYADTVSNTIIDEYNAEVQERARKILENKFKERKQRVPREFWDVFEEYANLGTFNSEYAQKATEKLFGEPGITLNEDLVQEFLNAETDEARTEVVDRIYDDVAQQIPKTAGDIVNAWRYFSMLGNPRTHIRNIMGNVASAAALDTSHKVSAVGQKFLPQGQRTRALHTSKAAKQFAKADYANVEAELSGNAYKTEMSEIKQRQKLFPKWMQWGMDKANGMLDVEDGWFKKGSYIKSMGNFLTARGWDVNNLTEAQLNEARQHAIQDAKIATFQDASALADTLGRLEKKNKATEVIIGSLVPFKRTPINVAKRSFELSPAGLLKAITYDAVQVKKGNMDATKMIDHIGQGLTGSGVAALGAFLAAQGIFSAGSSDDDKEANFDAGMGQQEYAINIGGKSYTIDWASPAVVPLAMGGELYEALHQKYDDEETAFNQAMATVSRMFDPMLNMTMLSGIGSTVSSAAYNKSNPLFGIASNVATNFGGQFVPTLFGQVARTVDNTRRTTYADKNSPVPSSVQKFLQRQANKIPGLSQYQPAYTDVWGREQKNGPDNVFARAAYNFFSPGYLADAKGTQAEKALKELYQATGDNSVLPSKPQKYYKAEDGTKKFLSASDYSKLTSQSGKISLDAINKLTKSEAYKQMSNDERIEAVADIYKYAKAIAANKVYKKELDGTTKIVSESGIEPGLYYAYKEMEDSLNNDMEGWEARDQVFNAIKADSSLSDQEKNGLYHSLLIKGTSQSQWDKYTEISGKVTAEEYVDAMIQKQAITKEGEDIEKGRASLEATEFSYYLDSKGYTGEKRQALEDTFKFYSMVKADPANYTFDMIRENGGTKEKAAIGEVESAGISAAQYAQIKSAASGVTYEKGKSGAKLAAVAKVVSQNTANYNEYAAVMHALGYKKIDGHYTSGGKLPEDSGLNTGINVNRSSASQKTSSAGFINPTTASNSVVTSGYGGRNAPKTSGGYGSSNHDGIDIGGTGGNLNGQAADSIGGGKVTEVGYDENGYGNYVVVDHGNGYTSLYGHLQKATVKQGETVSAGQQVGVIGSTGNSSGPHLHLRVRKNGQSIDPRTVIPGYK